MFLKPLKETSDVFVYPTEANDLGVCFFIFLAIFLLMNVLIIVKAIVSLSGRITSCITPWQSLET